MKTKVTLKNEKSVLKDLEPTLGNYYLYQPTGDIYILTFFDKKYWLNNLIWGSIYSEPSEKINEVFGGSEKHFELIREVEIKI